MARILVTGASGFIGMHVVKRLVSDGHQVRCMIRSSSSTELIRDEPLDFVHGELGAAETLEKAVENTDIVYHVAGLTRARFAHHFTTINVGGLENLLTVCARQQTPPRVVAISSLAAAGPARKKIPLVETDTPKPISAYGRSKLEMEKIATRFAAQVPISLVRPPYVVGEADVANAPLFQMIARYGIHPSPGWCDRDFSFVHATDLVAMLVKISERGESLTPSSLDATSADFGRGIYFTSSIILSFHEFGRRIGQALGREKTRVLRVPPVGVWGVGIFGEIRKWLTGRINEPVDLNKAREALSGPWICSNDKITQQLNFTPERSFDERLAQTANWYRAHKML